MALCPLWFKGNYGNKQRGGYCLATGNINEEISKLYLGGKKCFGKTSGLGINVHQKFIYETCWVHNHNFGKTNPL